MSHRTTILLVLAAVLSSCVTVSSRRYEHSDLGQPHYSLGRFDAGDGTYEDCALAVGSGGEATLEVSREVVHTQVDLGLTWRELDKPSAEQRGVLPYRGLLITGVGDGSAAATAGVQVGDVLTALNGEDTIYDLRARQVEAGLQPGARVPAQLVRGADAPLTVEIEVRTKETRATEQESIELIAPPTSETAYAGVVLRGMPPEWSSRIYGEGRSAVVISGVDVGSPAWLAGLRAGDVILEIDGQPTPDAAELVRVIQLRGATGQELPVVVRRDRPGDEYATTIHLRDFSGDSDVHVPLIVRAQSDVRSDRFTLGPFGIIVTSESEYVDSASREVQATDSFSMILGLFKVTSEPRSTEVRLLWFISIDT